jgi:hypothetical protein
MPGHNRYPTDWPPEVKHTDDNARVCRWRNVENVRAVRITHGRYRNAQVSGIFELFDPTLKDPIKVQPSGKRKVEVICAWQGYVPNATRGAGIDVSSSRSTVEIVENYSGDVVDNIGYPTDPLRLDF